MEPKKYCPRCGFANRASVSYCIRCGSPLTIKSEEGSLAFGAADKTQPMEDKQADAACQETTGVPSAEKTGEHAAETGATTEEASPQPVYAPSESLPGAIQTEGPANGTPACEPSAILTPARRRLQITDKRPVALLGSLALLISGVVIFLSVFLAYSSGPGRHLNGWEWFRLGNMVISSGGDLGTPFFVYFEGYPVFTGLSFLAIGIMVMTTGVISLVFGKRRTAVAGLVLCLITATMSLVNLISFLRQPGSGLGAGIILSLIFALLGAAGSAMILYSGKRATGFPPPPSIAVPSMPSGAMPWK